MSLFYLHLHSRTGAELTYYFKKPYVYYWYTGNVQRWRETSVVRISLSFSSSFFYYYCFKKSQKMFFFFFIIIFFCIWSLKMKIQKSKSSVIRTGLHILYFVELFLFQEKMIDFMFLVAEIRDFENLPVSKIMLSIIY